MFLKIVGVLLFLWLRILGQCRGPGWKIIMSSGACVEVVKPRVTPCCVTALWISRCAQMEQFSAKWSINGVTGAYRSSEKKLGTEGSITIASSKRNPDEETSCSYLETLLLGSQSNSILWRGVGKEIETERDQERPSQPLSCLLPANPAVSQNLLPALLVRRDVSLGPVAIKGLRAWRDACQGKQKDPAFCCPGKSLGDAVEWGPPMWSWREEVHPRWGPWGMVNCRVGGKPVGYFRPGPDWSQWRFCLCNICRRAFGENDPGLWARAAVSRGVVEASCCSWAGCPAGFAAPLLEPWLLTAYSFQSASLQLPSYGVAQAGCPTEGETQALCPTELPS